MMKRPIRNALVLGLVLTMALTALMGCTGTTGGATTTPAASSGGQPTAAATPTAAPPTQPEEPVKVVFYINNGFNADTSSNEDEIGKLRQWYIDEINVDFDYIIPPVEQAAEKLNLILSSDQQCDAFWGDWKEYSAKQMIQPITDLYDAASYPGIAQEFGPYMAVMTDGDGVLWGLPRTFDTAPYPYIYRQDYAEAVGVTQAPATIDELNTLLYLFQSEDVAGGGQTIPLICTDIGNLEWCLLAGYTGYGRGLWLDPSDSKVKLPQLQPGYIDFLTQVAQWYDDGILYKESFSINTTQLRELVSQGRVASSLQWYSAMGVALQQMYQADENTAAVGAFTHGLTGPKGLCETAAKGSSLGLVISAKASPEVAGACMKVVDFQLADLNAWYNATYGLDGWQFVEGSEVAAEPLTSDGNVGTATYHGEFRVAIGKLRIDEFTELLGKDKRYTDTNGQTAGIFFYWLYTENLYSPVNDVVQPFDFRLSFNDSAVAEEVAEKADIDRMLSEEIVKFATGVRPLSEWDAFIEDLYAIGMDKVEEAYTAQYADMQ